ncbi:MAG: fibronectin type III domain-containing protein, partial [Erysipelotrichaceae bacterium]|nr:fibronectin type III domain-containing protein [Erysipelotrichaceae bacterium]
QEDGMIGIYRDGETPSASLQPFYSVKLVEGQSEYDLTQGTKGRTLNYETVKDNTAFAVYLYREIDYAPVAIAEIEITDKIVSDRTTPATCYDDEIRYVVYEHNGKKYFIISPALGHDWKLDGFTWAEDYSSAEAKFVCTRDEAHTRVKQASVKVEKTAEKATYTAKVYGPDGVTYTEVKEVDLAPVKAPELVMIYNSANGGDLRFMPVEGAEEYIIMRKENGVWSEIRTLKDSAFEKLSNGAYQYIDETVKDSYGKGYIYSVAVKGNDDSLVYDSYGLALYRLDKPVITSVQKVSDTQVKVTWLDQKVHGYELQYSVDGGKKWTELEETTELALTVDLEANADYIFRLRAQKTNASRGKTWSQYSDWAKIGTLAKPQLIAIYNSADGVGVHFRPVETATSYILMKKENGVWSEVKEFKAEELKEEKGNLIIMDESVKDNYGKGYIYSVEASNGADRSGYNTKGLAIYRLAAPQISSVAVNGSSVTLAWNKVDAHGYEVQYSSDNGKTWEKAEEVTGTETTLELEAGKQYVFRVRCEKTNAQRGTTWSQYSPWRSATTR